MLKIGHNKQFAVAQQKAKKQVIKVANVQPVPPPTPTAIQPVVPQATPKQSGVQIPTVSEWQNVKQSSAINYIVSIQDTSLDGLELPNSQPGFAYFEDGNKLLTLMQNNVYFVVDYGQLLTFVQYWNKVWPIQNSIKNVIKYGPSQQNFQSYTQHTLTFYPSMPNTYSIPAVAGTYSGDAPVYFDSKSIICSGTGCEDMTLSFGNIHPNYSRITCMTSGSYTISATNCGTLYLYIGENGTINDLTQTVPLNAGQYIHFFAYPNAQTYTANNTILNIQRN